MELSFSEMLLIGLIAFLVLGPEELLRRSHQLGKWVNKFKTEANNFKIMTQNEVLNKDSFKDVVAPLKNLTQQIQAMPAETEKPHVEPRSKQVNP